MAGEIAISFPSMKKQYDILDFDVRKCENTLCSNNCSIILNAVTSNPSKCSYFFEICINKVQGDHYIDALGTDKNV